MDAVLRFTLAFSVVVAGATTPGTTTVTTSIASCPATSQCLTDRECSSCLDALRPFGDTVVGNLFANPPASYVDARAHQLGFFTALISGHCNISTNGLPSTLLNCTLHELSPSGMAPSTNTCTRRAGFAIADCQITEFECALDADCRNCLSALYTFTNTRGALRSAACQAANQTTLARLAYGINGNGCQSFPSCSFSKQQCANSTECSGCLNMLNRGQTHEAQLRCNVGTPARLLDNVVNKCVFTDSLACTFWQLRCSDVPGCTSCFDALGSGSTIVAGSSEPACDVLHHNFDVEEALIRIFSSCPTSTITVCHESTFFCVLGDPQCSMCLNGELDAGSAVCQALLNASGFGVTANCQPCSPTVFLINRIVTATAVVGVASAVACLIVILLLVAHSRDLVSMRDRIIIGLMVANVVYSIGNTIPLNRLRTGETDCGRVFLSFAQIRFGRAWWFAGKYSLVFFEIFILGASIWALLRGATLARRAEVAYHTICIIAGVIAFVTFDTRCREINNAGFNAEVQAEAQNGAVHNLDLADDHDDDAAGTTSAHQFDAARSDFAKLEQGMLQAWVGCLGVAIALWLYLRVAYTRALGRWRSLLAESKTAETGDEWAETRRSMWQASRELLTMQRDAYDEVARPLEGFVIVFVVFGIPVSTLCSRRTPCAVIAGANW